MRKFFFALLGTSLLAGLALAGEVTLVKYDAAKKEVTVKDDGGEKVYKLTDKTKFTMTDQDGRESAGDLAAAEKILKNDRAAGRAKFDITADKDAITAVKFKGRKKKN
jgi:hypothetical protein